MAVTFVGKVDLYGWKVLQGPLQDIIHGQSFVLWHEEDLDAVRLDCLLLCVHQLLQKPDVDAVNCWQVHGNFHSAQALEGKQQMMTYW